MKFLWQQVIGLLLVIFVALAIIATRMEDYITTSIEESRQEQLMNYGRNIIGNNFSREDLYRASQLLASENILIQVYLPDGRTIYPSYDQRNNASLSQEDLNQLNSNEVLGFRTIERITKEGKSEQYLTVYLPHHDVGEFPTGFISLGAPLDDLEQELTQVRENIYLSVMVAIFIGVLISIAYAFFQTRKIHRLQSATKEISQGNYDLQIDTSGKDEFGDLARDFDAMTQSLMESQEEIKRQEDLRRQFMMDVAHEMRTPLTTMGGISEGLINHVIPDKHRQRSLELIYRETQRLTRLVNENLDYEKVRTGQFTLSPVRINGKKFFTGIKSQMDLKAQEKDDQIILDIEEGLTLWGDHDRLSQIFINLITNAIQFSNHAPITIRGRRLEKGVEIKVIDQGIGMDAKELKRIWERFYKVDVSRKNTKFGESGIGLSLVKTLIDAHHGTIDVESSVNKGSVFTIFLPGADSESEEV